MPCFLRLPTVPWPSPGQRASRDKGATAHKESVPLVAKLTEYGLVFRRGRHAVARQIGQRSTLSHDFRLAISNRYETAMAGLIDATRGSCRLPEVQHPVGNVDFQHLKGTSDTYRNQAFAFLGTLFRPPAPRPSYNKASSHHRPILVCRLVHRAPHSDPL